MPLFVKYNPGLLDLLVLLDETGLQTPRKHLRSPQKKTYSPVCELVKFPNKKQVNPKFRDVISQTMVYHHFFGIYMNLNF